MKWIKRYGITVWLLVAILALAVTVSYAAYVNREINKFVLATGKGNQAFFGSNYLYLVDAEETQYRNRRISPPQNELTFPVIICNYVYGNNQLVNIDDITYSFAVKLYPNGGSELPSGVEQIYVTVDGAGNQNLNAAGSLEISGQKLPGGTANSHEYEIVIPEALKDKVLFEITATPNDASLSATNNQKLAAMITIADKTVSHGWSGRFLDDTTYAPSYYSGFNYEISGTGEGTITLSWDPRLEISKWFLDDNGLKKPQNTNSDRYYEITLPVGGKDENDVERPAAYQLQFYLAGVLPTDTAWSDLTSMVKVQFQEKEQGSTPQIPEVNETENTE